MTKLLPDPMLRLTALASLVACLFAGGACGHVLAAEAAPREFKLVDGDRVVLLGGTTIERLQSYGYLESALTTRFAPAKIQFRNLGWSGDTVFGEARAGFGKPAEGFAHLRQHVLELKPTVVLLNYGANESFEGQEGLPKFLEGLSTLLKTLDETKARIVFLAPTPHEDLGRPLPDPAEHNRQLALYSSAIAKVAHQRGDLFVNLFELLGKKLSPPSSEPLTDDGLHFTEYGNWRVVPAIEAGLWLAPRKWFIDIDAKQRNIAANGVMVSDARFAGGEVAFQAVDVQLPLPPAPAAASAKGIGSLEPRVIRVFGLPAGKYALRIDGRLMGAAPAEAWAAGVGVDIGPDIEQAEQLRQTINAKNELYFHRWRPQNITYLFGFRKHEQGNNAVEIPQFDPLVEEKENEIHKLAQPVEHRYEIIRVDAP